MAIAERLRNRSDTRAFLRKLGVTMLEQIVGRDSERRFSEDRIAAALGEMYPQEAERDIQAALPEVVGAVYRPYSHLRHGYSFIPLPRLQGYDGPNSYSLRYHAVGKLI